MLSALLEQALPGGSRGCLSTLIFHRVTPAPDPLFPGEMHASAFDEVCRWLRKSFNVLSLADAVKRLQAGKLPGRALCITFDDGYADNHDVALPILQRHGLPATCFVATGFLDGGCMWNDRVIEAVRLCRHDTLPSVDDLLPGPPPSLRDDASRRRVIDQLLQALKYLPIEQRLARTDALVAAAGVTLPRNLMMSTPQVAALARAGVTIGGHTVNHPILARMGDEAAYREIVTGREVLEGITQQGVELFAYPNGRPDVDFGARDVALARRAGFKAAVTTAWGVSRRDDDLFQLPRFTPWDHQRWRYTLRLALNARHPVRTCAPLTPGAAS